ncbi:hypothetical protein D3C75_1193150 [compost metagenome]
MAVADPKRHRLGQLLAPASALGFGPRAVVALAEPDQLHTVVFVQHHLGIAQVAPIQFHPNGQRVTEQMLAEFGRHMLALFQQAG